MIDYHLILVDMNRIESRLRGNTTEMLRLAKKKLPVTFDGKSGQVNFECKLVF